MTRFLSEQKRQNPCHEHDQQNRQHEQHNIQSKKKERMYQQTQSQNQHCQTNHWENMICQLTEITVNPKERYAIKREIVGNTGNKTHQTLPTKVTIEERDAKRRSTRKSNLSNYAQD